MNHYDEIPPALQSAISIWTSGGPLPVDKTAELLEMGYDVAALEQRYAL